MAIISLLFGNQNQPNVIGGLSIDATLEEFHERQAEVTDHPVEGGSFIQDHIVNRPKRVRIRGMITDTPLNRMAGTYVADAFETLEGLYEARELITAVTGFTVYDNMAIESISMPRAREGALRFSIDLKQVTLTAGQTVPIEPTAGETDAALSEDNVADPDTQANGTNAGRQSPTAADEAERELGSGLYNLIFN